MPEKRKGESRSDWNKRCIPYVKKHEGLTQKQAEGKCNGMYDNKSKKHAELYLEGMSFEEGKEYAFMFDCDVGDSINSTDDKPIAFQATEGKGYNAVVVIGDRFMKGVFVSSEELKKVYKGWNNTLHDLNHMGTGYQAMFSVIPADVSYVVGFQNNLSYDSKTKEVRADIHINEKSVRFNEWESYISICDSIKRPPNVSMYTLGKLKWIEARELPKGSHYKKHGLKADDAVPYMYDLVPVAVSTVYRGACNEKDGCGIKHGCSINKDEEKNEEKPEDAEKRAYLEKRIKQLK